MASSSISQIPHSWHIPITQYRTGHQVPILYLQILPRASRDAILARIYDYDEDWTHELTGDTRAARFDIEEIVEYPYIRDGTFEPSSICIFLERLQKAYEDRKTAILVDSDIDDDSCIVVSWLNAQASLERKLTVSAARIPQSIARPFLSLISSGHASSVEEVLGDEYNEAKVDLALDFAHKANEVDIPAFKPPALLPQDLSLCRRDRLSIISLTPLGDDSRQALQTQIANENSRGTAVEVYDWEGPSPSRGELYQLFEWLESNAKDSETLDYVFFVDDLLRNADGSHAIITASRITSYGYKARDLEQMVLLPVKAGNTARLWHALLGDLDESDKADQKLQSTGRTKDVINIDTVRDCCDMWAGERVLNPRRPYEQISGLAPTVWYLRDFSLDEQREIRARLAEQHEYDPDDGNHEFFYMGYPFPDDGQKTHTLEELCDLFQKCDPYSPSFDSAYSKRRFNNYPDNFIALDDRALASDSPLAMMGSTLDLHFPGQNLGWQVGTVELGQAYNAWCNFDIANVGPAELFDDEGEVQFLNDLNDFKPGYLQHVEENGYGGDYDADY